jgi:hypothetical protein
MTMTRQHGEMVDIMTRQHNVMLNMTHSKIVTNHLLIYNNMLCLLFVHFMMVIMMILRYIHTPDPKRDLEYPKGYKLLDDKC